MRSGTRPSRLLWLAPGAFLLAVVLGVTIVRASPRTVFGVTMVLLAVVPVAWVVVSALWPARAERRCPACGQDTLARLDPASVVGLRCRKCAWNDPSASAWLLAEEEGPLERLVLRSRRRVDRKAADD